MNECSERFGLNGAFGKLTDDQFNFLSKYLSVKYGLRISADKRTLLESRLVKRLSALKLTSIAEYLKYIFETQATINEYRSFIDIITTHKTFFFRENNQFEFFRSFIPEYFSTIKGPRQLMVWSAGCSSGEEAYTIGMVLNEIHERTNAIDYKIIATDISVPTLEKASKGIFDSDLELLPEGFKKKYFKIHKGTDEYCLEFNSPQIKNRIHFGVFNLNKKEYNLPYMFDFIFCRNVIIYFDAKTRAEVLKKMVDKLRPGGLLFLGHSETAIGTSLPLKSIQPTIYQKI